MATVAAHLLGCAVAADGSEPLDPPFAESQQAVATGQPDNPQSPVYPYVGRWTTASGGSCSGTLITSQWVLTAAHCFNGWQNDCITNFMAGEPFSLTPNLTANITITFGPGITGTHTAAVSGPALVRTQKLINACSNSDTANDIALFKLDQPIRPELVFPLHPPLSNHPENWCSTLVGDHDDFDGVLVGYGGLGVRNSAASSNWNLEDVGTGYVYRNSWGFNTYQGLQPGDSGGPLLTAGAWENGRGFPERRLCGVNSRSYYVFPGLQQNASAVAAVDFSDNRLWIEQAVLRPGNPNGRPDGGFQGERLPQQDLFAIGTDGALHVQSVVRNGFLGTPWRTVGNNGVALAKVSAVSWSPQRIDVFAAATDDVIDHAFSTDGGQTFDWDSWGKPADAWTNLGIEVVSGRPNRLDIFATYTTSSGASLYHRSWDNGVDSDWQDVGPGPANYGNLSGPGAAAAAFGPDSLDVWTTSRWYYGGSSLQHAFSRDGGATWGWDEWTPSGFQISGDPDATSWGPDRLDVFVAGVDKLNHHIWWQEGASNWDTWDSIQGAPTAVSMGPGSLTVAHIWESGRAFSPNTIILESYHMPPGSIAQSFSHFAYPEAGWTPVDIDLSSF